MPHLSIIYKLVALQIMIAECNSTLDRLGLQELRISSPAALTGFDVDNPVGFGDDYANLAGSLNTTNFMFSLSHQKVFPGFSFTRTGPGEEEAWLDLKGERGVPRASVSDAGAYGLARGWLERMGIDVPAMEHSYGVAVEQRHLPRGSVGSERGLVSSKYDVIWRRRGATNAAKEEAAGVRLDLASERLVSFRIREGSLSFHRHAPPDVPHAVAVSQLPDEPVYQLLGFGVGTPLRVILRAIGDRYTNAFALLRAPEGYEEKLSRRLLDETREIIAILGCTQLDDPRPENLTDLYVTPPAFGGGGRIAFKNGHAEFDSEGKLRSFDFVPRGHGDRVDWQHTAKLLITTNEAYQIATQRLAALSVDLDYLNGRYRRYLWRPPFQVRDPSSRMWKREWRQSPEYHLVWRDTNLPPQAPSTVKVSVYGDIKEVGTIELNDNACWRRPPVVVTNGARPL